MRTGFSFSYIAARGFLLAAVLLRSHTAQAATQYVVTDLGPLGTDGTTGNVNNSGQVVYDNVATSGAVTPFTYQNGVLTNLSSTIGGIDPTVNAINDPGDIVGSNFSSSFILYHDGTRANFALPANADSIVFPNSVNKSAAVAANYQVIDPIQGPTQVAIRWVDGNSDRIPQTSEYQTLASRPGDISTTAVGLNSSGVIVGVSTSTTAGHAVRWVGTAVTDLGASSTKQSQALAINNGGVIVGAIGDASVLYTPFLWDPVAGLTSIPAVGQAASINNLNQVVGGFNNGDSAGWIWSQATGFQALQGLIAPGSGWTLDQATSINDNGQIVGVGILNGVREGYLLTPTPEPSSIALVAMVAPLLRRGRRTRRK